MKRVLCIAATLIMVLVLTACSDDKGTSTEEGNAEKELVRKIVLTGETTDKDIFDSIIIGMDSSDATYFTVNYNGGTQGVESSHHNMYSVDEATFNEMSPIDVGQFSDLITEGAETFLNSSYGSINGSAFDSSTGTGMFGGLLCDSMASETIEPLFGGSVAGYFDEHKLSLSCEEVAIEQVAVSEYMEHYTYVYGVFANVKTEDCTGDMSDLGFFANNGESRNVKVYVVCTYWPDENDITLSYMNIK